jgi:hypothetical protein
MDAKLKKVIKLIHEMRSNAQKKRRYWDEKGEHTSALIQSSKDLALLQLLEEVEKILNE